ncbi:NAD(P)-dependent oxidoreductase [Pseudarthrobacter sulfonivorans]|uniref:NAD(P)-dependent oxidoreductase n=1 Tax=Pseudarthrobacter sulfonivorans TaxID=121292 RepID=UPI0028559C66|nr:NAD(P)-dependent oxidoreductase [Pseudarthrobacter sulfonivorans]MDR6415246.1 2-hydroxy-3-oxopropionate reductase [Pseudarthrobacter sulfonivorans]
MTVSTRPSLALLGLGPMGGPMAHRLLDFDSGLTVWNRTPAKAEPLVALGARAATSPADAASGVVLTVLPDLDQVESLLPGEYGLLSGWAAKNITRPTLVVHGTVSPIAVAAFAERLLRKHGVTVLDAPVSGGTLGAEEGTLSIMVGGDKEAAHSVEHIFQAMGTTVRYMGPSGSGALAKACNQVVVAATVTAVSEAMLLARSGGLDLAVMLELLQGGLADSAVLRQKGSRWISSDFTGGGSGKNQLKDLGFIREAATAEGLELPLTGTVTELFGEMVAQGDGALDHTGIQRTLARRSQVPLIGSLALPDGR